MGSPSWGCGRLGGQSSPVPGRGTQASRGVPTWDSTAERQLGTAAGAQGPALLCLHLTGQSACRAESQAGGGGAECPLGEDKPIVVTSNRRAGHREG